MKKSEVYSMFIDEFILKQRTAIQGIRMEAVETEKDPEGKYLMTMQCAVESAAEISTSFSIRPILVRTLMVISAAYRAAALKEGYGRFLESNPR